MPRERHRLTTSNWENALSFAAGFVVETSTNAGNALVALREHAFPDSLLKHVSSANHRLFHML